MAVLTMNVQEK